MRKVTEQMQKDMMLPLPGLGESIPQSYPMDVIERWRIGYGILKEIWALFIIFQNNTTESTIRSHLKPEDIMNRFAHIERVLGIRLTVFDPPPIPKLSTGVEPCPTPTPSKPGSSDGPEPGASGKATSDSSRTSPSDSPPCMNGNNPTSDGCETPA